MPVLRDVNHLRPLLDIFPVKERIKYCFAYGSAVFEQKFIDPSNRSSNFLLYNKSSTHNIDDDAKIQVSKIVDDSNGKSLQNIQSNSQSGKMIDLVIAVDDSFEFHRENLLKNFSHYSALKHLGAGAITKIQKCFGPKIFYNTLIPINGDYIKYGVISRDDLITDLLDWNSFYTSGRLHKPNLTLQRDPNDSELLNALKINIQSAVHVALLLLPERFQEHQFYLTIAGLSYSGDFRMKFGEDKKKVEKIVAPQMNAFRQKYNPLLSSDLFKDIVSWKSHDGVGMFEQNCSTNAIQWHLCLLPKTVQHYLLLEWIRENITSPRQRIAATRMDIDDLLQRLAGDITYRDYLKSAISRIVFKSSSTQSIKGILTAGLAKSTTYSFEKIQKMIKSMK